MYRRRLIPIFLLAILLNGCGTIPVKLERPIEKSRTFEASFEDTWKAMIQMVAGEAVTLSDKDSGLIGFKKNTNLGDWKKYSLIPKRNYWTYRSVPVITINILVRKEDERHTLVTVNSKIVCAIFCNLGSVCNVEFGSNGLVEKEYLDKIQELLLLKSNYTKGQ